MRASVLYILILVFFSVGCSDGLKSEETRIDEALILDEQTLQGRIYYIDSIKSFISWAGTNTETTHYGIIHITSGQIMLKDSAIAGGEILIDMTKIEILDLKDNPADSANLSAFLASRDVFYISNFPVAKFVIDSIIVIPPSSAMKSTNRQDLATPSPNHLILGTLTLKGVSIKLKFPSRIDLRYYKLQGIIHFDF